ncbi:MAG: 50S ribosomal protein L30 [Methanomassiliicoccales archaeon]|nr:50S ribosomal protein L30 [Methanomassiliicoccales archaeon]
MYAVIRVRGHGKIIRKAVETMDQMHLNRVNHMVLLPETETTRRMLQVVKDYVTWGEVSEELLSRALETASKHTGEKRVSVAELGKKYGQEPSELLKALMDGKTTLSDFDIKTVLRLHPPRKGWEAIKKSYATGGSLGYRGRDINALIEKMLPSQGGV